MRRTNQRRNDAKLVEDDPTLWGKGTAGDAGEGGVAPLGAIKSAGQGRLVGKENSWPWAPLQITWAMPQLQKPVFQRYRRLDALTRVYA